MIYMEYGQQAERLLSSQVHRSLSSLWKELLGSSIPTDKWLMTPCKWARDNLHWYISAHLKCKLCSTHRGLNTPQLPLSTRHNCKLNEYSIQLHLARYQCGPVYLTPVTQFMVSSPVMTRGVSVTMSHCHAWHVMTPLRALITPDTRVSSELIVTNNGLSLTTNKKSIQEKFSPVFLVTCWSKAHQ